VVHGVGLGRQEKLARLDPRDLLDLLDLKDPEDRVVHGVGLVKLV